MQAYDVGGGQIRWDGMWESGGNHGQSKVIASKFNDFVRRWDQEMAAGKRLVRMQAYDFGGGDLRYDGVWENDASPQRRILGMTLAAFADHFDELTSSGWHVEHMSACLRRYSSLPAPASLDNAVMPADRGVFFGSDFERAPANMTALPIPPLSARGAGCDLGRS
jgi:hypothetical protein